MKTKNPIWGNLRTWLTKPKILFLELVEVSHENRAFLKLYRSQNRPSALKFGETLAQWNAIHDQLFQESCYDHIYITIQEKICSDKTMTVLAKPGLYLEKYQTIRYFVFKEACCAGCRHRPFPLQLLNQWCNCDVLRDLEVSNPV